jgi:hypothetical protein
MNDPETARLKSKLPCGAVFELLSEHLNFIYSLENGHSPQGNLDLSLAVSAKLCLETPYLMDFRAHSSVARGTSHTEIGY